MTLTCANPLSASCDKCQAPLLRRLKERVSFIAQTVAEEPGGNWLLGYSGGKDSSALLKLMYSALRDLRPHKPLLSVVYCDTGVEIPVMRDHVRKTLRGLRQEAQNDGLNIRIKIAQPILSDRYFVKVIGRGYPPPTNKFRWCTDRLRILPIQNFLKATGSAAATVVIGTRLGESVSRDRILAKHRM